jgi:hypothetical protein
MGQDGVRGSRLIIVAGCDDDVAQRSAFGESTRRQRLIAVEHCAAPYEPSLGAPCRTNASALPSHDDSRREIELGGKGLGRQSQAVPHSGEFLGGHAGKLIRDRTLALAGSCGPDLSVSDARRTAGIGPFVSCRAASHPVRCNQGAWQIACPQRTALPYVGTLA